MNEGRWVRTTMSPLRKPIVSATAKARRTLSVIGTWKVIVGSAIIMPEKPIIEPTREVEFAADHQQRRADGDDHQVAADRRPIEDAVGREHARAARRDAEEDEDENDAGQCAEVRPAEELAQTGLAYEAFVARRRGDGALRSRRRSFQPLIDP